ncbi:MAG: hypothetical protein WCG80_15345 [Spirochaetales bacterium]
MSGLSGISGVSPYSYYAQPINGKLEVPVQPGVSLFAQFQFVQGVPSAEGGLSLDRVQVIDSLLSQINSHRTHGAQPIKRETLDLANPEQTIEKLSKQVYQMQSQAQPYKAWGSVTGLVLDVKA